VKRLFVLAAALGLVACHRQGAADVTLDADADARNATAAKTLADLAAADAAVKEPAPEALVHPHGMPAASAPEEDGAPTDQPPADLNDEESAPQ
jgi:hypothetical protein